MDCELYCGGGVFFFFTLSRLLTSSDPSRKPISKFSSEEEINIGQVWIVMRSSCRALLSCYIGPPL